MRCGSGRPTTPGPARRPCSAVPAKRPSSRWWCRSAGTVACASPPTRTPGSPSTSSATSGDSGVRVPCRWRPASVTPSGLTAGCGRVDAGRSRGAPGSPRSAKAAVLQLSGTGAKDLTRLVVYPAGADVPRSSDLSVPKRRDRTNLVVVPLGDEGRLRLLNRAPAVGVSPHRRRLAGLTRPGAGPAPARLGRRVIAAAAPAACRVTTGPPVRLRHCGPPADCCPCDGCERESWPPCPGLRRRRGPAGRLSTPRPPGPDGRCRARQRGVPGAGRRDRSRSPASATGTASGCRSSARRAWAARARATGRSSTSTTPARRGRRSTPTRRSECRCRR